MEKGSSELNPAQLKAVKIGTGPALVVAGAGTGKTSVIVERIVRLVEGGQDRRSIAALTFTEKAAQEMLDRVSATLPGSYGTDMTITTFNSFGHDLLREFAPEIGLSGTLKLLGDTGKIVFLREHLDELELDYFSPISSPEGQIDNLASYFSLLKQQLVTPAAYADYAKDLPSGSEEERLEKQRHSELARAFGQYLSLARSQNFIDYDDQLYLLAELLQARPNVLKKLQRRFEYLLVDEFQDTNPMQSKVIDLLAAQHKNLMVVGDDDQSIYGWRGATLANILSFKQRYPKTKEVTLTRNYRSGQRLLDAAYKLIQHNNPDRLEAMHGLNKRLVAEAGAGAEPELKSFPTLPTELDWIAQDIKQRLEAGEDPGGIAVLSRRNQTARRVHEALELAGIEHVLAGADNDLYRHPAVATIIEALKTVVDPSDDRALYHTLGGPLFAIKPELLAEPSAMARRRHNGLWTALVEVDEAALNQALELIKDWRSRVHQKSVGQLAYDIITDSGWKDQVYHRAELDIDGLAQAQALSAWFATVKDFERAADTPSAVNYLDNLEVLKSAGDELGDDTLLIDGQNVSVMSVHKAKGLEWDTVYIADLTEYSFPMKPISTSLSVPAELMQLTQADEHYAEERRLMYVAMTRARQRLVMTFSATHTGLTRRQPSRFLKEIFGDIIDQEAGRAAEPVSLELFSATQPPAKGFRLPQRLRSGQNLVLSASQVGDYLRCPQDFHYRHILGVPQPPNPTTQVGTLLHEYIQRINQAKQSGSPWPPLNELLKDLEDNWPQDGYASAHQRERALTTTLKHFKALYERLKTDPIPAQIEQSFRAAIPEAKLLLTGRLDAVFDSANGAEIHDYKSGTSVTDAAKAKARATASSQLAIYALAWRLQHGEMPSLLTLDFVQTGQVGSVKKQPKTIDNLQSKLKIVADDIRAGEFPPGRDHAYCRHPLND